jgi:HlyD family secretion protein
MKNMSRILAALIWLAPLGASVQQADAQEDGRYQGYVEGDYLYLGAQFGGRIVDMGVLRGTQVDTGDVLFQIDSAREQAALDGALALAEAARKTMEDLQQGLRPSEMAAIEARLVQAEAAQELSRLTLARQRDLEGTGAASQQRLDVARATHDRDTALVAQLEAEVQTARLGARVDQIEAARAQLRRAESAVAEARWALEQRIVLAPASGTIEDIYFRPGEVVQAGQPVISMLPPENIKVRFFVREPDLETISLGQQVAISCSSCPPNLKARVSFIGPEAEFTPPVIYSEDVRDKLVFMIEARFGSITLRPGQPVDVAIR